MGKKMIKFTDKKKGSCMEMLSSSLGHHVFDITKNVNEMNATVRWCNAHGIGDVLDKETYRVEIISID